MFAYKRFGGHGPSRGRSRSGSKGRGPVRLNVNGTDHVLDVPHDTPLLYILRNDLALNGPKFGCGLGECGACTVLIDDVAARACAVPVGIAQGRRIVTLEGLGTAEAP